MTNDIEWEFNIGDKVKLRQDTKEVMCIVLTRQLTQEFAYAGSVLTQIQYGVRQWSRDGVCMPSIRYYLAIELEKI